MALAQLSSRLAVCGRSYVIPVRALKSIPFLASPAARLLASRPMPPPAAKGKAAPAPAPEPEDYEEDEFDEGQDPLADLNAAARRRVVALKEVQKQYDDLQREYLKELAALQSKYSDKYAPLFDERKQVVLGKKAVEKFDIEDDGDKDAGIPEFWLNALANSKAGPFITDRDAEVLRFLEDIRYEVLTGEDRGFKLRFEFADNPHFENKVLEKTYLLEAEDDVVPKEFRGCKIDWKEGMDVTVDYVKKRAKPAKGEPKGARPTFVTEKVPCDSFFNIFDPPKVPNAQEAEAMSMEELDEVQEALGNDYDIGASIKDKVIPRAVEWFTGEIQPLDYDYDQYEDEFEDGDY